MAGRRTNIALLALLAIAFVTGLLSWAIGTSVAAAIVVAHGVAGLAILVLAPWKRVIVSRGLRRRRAGLATSVLLAVLVVACVVTGLVHASGLLDLRGPLSPLGLHVATGVGAVVVGLWHVMKRPVPVRAADLSRRNLLRVGALGAGAGVAYLAFEGALRVSGARGTERRFTGSHATGSFVPEQMPVTQWFDDAVPSIEARDWRLLISNGAVQMRLGVEDLSGSSEHLRATIDCTGGWYAEQEWRGVRLDRLLGGIGGSQAVGRSVYVRSATGYARRFPMADAPSMMLATAVGDEVLSVGHGFPARLVVPGRRGFWWVKWVTEIRVDDTPWWWQPPFPVT